MFKNIEDKENKDKELSIKEKAVIIGAYSVGRIILRKVRKAKTYGDLIKLGSLLEIAIDESEAEQKENETEAMEEKRMHSMFKNITNSLK